ncbi:MAG TPA: alpha/beta hydrolase [Edaphobacter sp.]|jgi:pimeloyl-ACP methyl ester carboxylesterase|nr:alpha/beta hydrolase [Edaphobacter sp.]
MDTITVKDGTQIFYKDWGMGQPLFFHHGWPLTADDWDAQMMFFLEKGYRVIAHDRRGHGRSTQTFLGHDMDTYAADVAELVETLDLHNSIHIGTRPNWWRQGMMGSITAHYQFIKVLSETEFYDDLKMIDIPVLVMHGEDDQICPFLTTGARSVKLLKHGTLKSYPGLPHGMPTTHADQINADLLVPPVVDKSFFCVPEKLGASGTSIALRREQSKN